MRIVAVGGGEIGRPGTRRETVEIDRSIVSLSGRKRPRLLFLPTASGDAAGYVQVISEYFGSYLGCSIDTMLLFKNRPSDAEMRQKVDRADIVYVGGGNTLRMLKMWRRVGLDKMLIRAGKNGAVLSGISAGAVCWFAYANSDSRKSVDPDADYIRVRGLGLHEFLVCPHYDVEKERQASVKRMLRGTRMRGLALDNRSAIVISDDTYRVVTTGTAAAVRLLGWRDGEYEISMLPVSETRPLSELEFT